MSLCLIFIKRENCVVLIMVFIISRGKKKIQIAEIKKSAREMRERILNGINTLFANHSRAFNML